LLRFRHSSANENRALMLCRSLLTERGEVSGSKIAGDILALYRSMDADARRGFFDGLAQGFSPSPTAVAKAAEDYRNEPSPKTLIRLQKAVEPPRQELFRRLNMVPDATALLVALRGELVHESNPLWEGLVEDLGHLFSSWFNRGFLRLERIDWNTPAAVLEKLIRYEAVHPIQGFMDVRRRLAADRRCYAYFHPAMPEEPIIFVQVALTRGLSASVQPLLDSNAPELDPTRADTAIFYSITNCHDGLRGVPFGSFLIKQVAEDLREKLPRLRKFATLSPVPGFAAWLRKQPEYESLAKDLVGDPPAALKETLTSLCARYLLHAKSGKEPLDPVARFHLRNGARLERINWMGDTSETGLQRSFGLMVNYSYRLADIEENHEAYAQKGAVVCAYAIESAAKTEAR
jgi:malonyl-CoA decarboxylase